MRELKVRLRCGHELKLTLTLTLAQARLPDGHELKGGKPSKKKKKK